MQRAGVAMFVKRVVRSTMTFKAARLLRDVTVSLSQCPSCLRVKTGLDAGVLKFAQKCENPDEYAGAPSPDDDHEPVGDTEPSSPSDERSARRHTGKSPHG